MMYMYTKHIKDDLQVTYATYKSHNKATQVTIITLHVWHL